MYFQIKPAKTVPAGSYRVTWKKEEKHGKISPEDDKYSEVADKYF